MKIEIKPKVDKIAFGLLPKGSWLFYNSLFYMKMFKLSNSNMNAVDQNGNPLYIGDNELVETYEAKLELTKR